MPTTMLSRPGQTKAKPLLAHIMQDLPRMKGNANYDLGVVESLLRRDTLPNQVIA